MAYLEADAEKIPLDALGTTANAVNWTIEAIAELPVGDREYGYDPLVPYGVEPAGHAWLHSLASGKRAENIARARELLTLPIIPVDAIKAASTNADQPQTPEHRCPCCGDRMIIIERFERGATPRSHPSPPTPVIRIVARNTAARERTHQALCAARDRSRSAKRGAGLDFPAAFSRPCCRSIECARSDRQCQ